MRKNNIIWIVLFFSLVLLNVFSLYKKNNDFNHLERIADDSQGAINILKKNINFREIAQFQSENVNINKNMILNIEAENKIEEYKLGDLFSGQPKFVFDISVIDCIKCGERNLEYEMALIKKLNEEIGSDNLLLIGHYRNQYDVEVFQRLHKLDIPIYNKQGNDIGIPLQEKNIPYMFFVDSDLKTRHVFVPDPQLPQLSKDYISFIAKILH